MELIDNLDEKKYLEFEKKCSKDHFLQSYAWGQFAIKGKKSKPLYMALMDNGNVLCAALFLKKELPLGYSYVYSPRGYLIDFNNYELLREFTKLIKIYMKRNKIIYVRLDPDIKYHDIDENANPTGKFDNYNLFSELISLGYIHKGFNKLYEGNQPRYTFRIDLNKSLNEIESGFNKSLLKTLKRSYNYDLIIDNEPNIDKFCYLNKYNSQKDSFNAYSKDYFTEFYKQFNKYKNVKFFNASVDVNNLLLKINDNIKELEMKIKNDKKHEKDLKEQLNKQIKDKELFEKLPKEIIMVCSLICVYTKDTVWSLYIGSDDIANQTFAVTRCYYESILDAKNNNYKVYDMFGTVGDTNTKYKNLAKLHDYKRKYGMDYIEFIGEFDLVNNKFLYKMLPYILKIYRKVRK